MFFSELVVNSLRSTDLFGRIGGEEFAIVLHATSFEVAKEIADKLRTFVEMSEFMFEKRCIKLSMSIGIRILIIKILILPSRYIVPTKHYMKPRKTVGTKSGATLFENILKLVPGKQTQFDT